MSDEKDPFSSGYDPTAGYQFGVPESPGVVPYAEPEPDKKPGEITSDVVPTTITTPTSLTIPPSVSTEVEAEREDEEDKRESAFDRAILRMSSSPSTDSGLIARILKYEQEVQKQIKAAPPSLQPFIRKEITEFVAQIVVFSIGAIVSGFIFLAYGNNLLVIIFLGAIFITVQRYVRSLALTKTFTWIYNNSGPIKATARFAIGVASNLPDRYKSAPKDQARCEVVSVVFDSGHPPIPPVKMIWQKAAIRTAFKEIQPCEVYVYEGLRDEDLLENCVIIKTKSGYFWGETNKILVAEDSN